MSVVLPDGSEWLTVAEACGQLGPDITPAMIRDWRRRGLVRAHTIRVGRSHITYHHAGDLVTAERQTRRRGRHRTTVDPASSDDLRSEAISI